MTEDQVFLAALDIPDAATRNAYLDEVCAGNASLRQQVEALLVAHLKSGEFMNTPAPEQAGLDTHPSGAATIQTSDISETVDFTEEPERLSFLGPPTRPDSLGRLEHYEALQVLGRGAFGIVLRAFDEVLQRVVAIKVMAPQLAATSPARKRFLREARMSAQVRNENVVQVYEVGEKPLPFLVMECIPGETLQERLDRVGPLEVPEVLQIGRQIAEGLAAAHARDLIHRDIKPGNVLLEGDRHKVKITDFGLARAADDASMTQSGMIAGTPLYMAPEQALGHMLDQRADLFSLGSVLYQMITGRPPFRANSTIAVLKRVVEDTPRDMREVIPETPAWLCDIIAKLHEKEPDDRYQSAREVADVIADCQEQLKAHDVVRDLSRIPRSKAPPWSRRILVAGLLCLAIPLIYFATIFLGPEIGWWFRKPPVSVMAVHMQGWGDFINLAGDCTAVTNGDRLTITAPGKRSVNLNPGVGYRNVSAPRVMRTVDGDFVAEVEVLPFDDPDPNTALDGRNSWKGAGLVVWLDDRSLLRLEVAGYGESEVGRRRLHIEWFQDAKRVGIVSEALPQGPAHLRLERRGETLLPSVSSNGQKWIHAKPITDLRMPAQIQVGVFATNTTRHAHVAELANLQIQTDGWTQLFNGKDLTGWKTHPEQPGSWDVTNGILVGHLAQSHLFSERADFANFHLRAEVKLNQGGDSGIRFRAPFVLARGKEAWQVQPGGGYEAEFNRFPGSSTHTGSVQRANPPLPPSKLFLADPGSLILPDEWATYEVIADGNRIVTKLNGREVANCVDPDSMYSRGHFALQCFNSQTVVQFRKIEIKELPAEASTSTSTFTNSLGMEFVLVPKGKSWLGGGKDKLGDQEVEIPADFYLAKYEVTQGEWERVMGANPSWYSRNGAGASAVKDISDANLRRFPVEHVSWDDCQLFVANLNRLGKEPGWVYRLPTEVEWEYACRGGPMVDQADSAFDFCFGQRTNTLLPEHANFGAQSERQGTCEVGAYQANRLGLFDMHGNVLEFCENAEKDDDGTLHYPVRGGNWTSGAHICRAGWRHLQTPSDRNGLMGLRLARVPTGASEPETQAPVGLVPFSAVDVQRVAVLPAAQQVEEVRQELMRLNPGFDGQVTPTIDGGVVTEFSVNTDEILDVSPIRALTKLVYLDLRGTYPNKGKLSDLSPLAGMTISRLDCSSTQIADLSPLAGLPLTYLHFNHNPVSDLAPLKGMPLEELGLAETQVADLSPLKGMKIKVLGAQLLPVTDLSPLAGMPLTGLDLYHTTGVTSLEPLHGMPLEGINLQDVPVSDLEPLKGMTTLRTLLLQGNKVSDLSPLANLKLTDLLLFGEQITDLTPLKGQPLSRLIIHSTGVSDLRPVAGMPLVEIRLNPQNINQGLHVLRDIKTLQTIGIDGNRAWPPAEFWERYDQGEFTK